MQASIENGADAVYLGLKEFSARAFAENFTLEEIPSIVKILHNKNKKLYIALNTIIKENEINEVVKILSVLDACNIDAVIVQDLGIIYLINKFFPNLRIHASTQMTNLNSLDAEFLKKNNIKRLVLDRQLKFEEIREIAKNSPIEVETFIHGALCYSISGQCYSSSFLGGYSANRGRCTQPCRRSYLLNKDKIGYYFSPNDLSTVDVIEEFLKINIKCFKIEGRMKNVQYVSNVTSAYRLLIDSYYTNNVIPEKIKKDAKELIKNSYGRKGTFGIYFNKGNIIEPKLSGATGAFVGKILETTDQYLKIFTNIPLNVGDKIRIQQLRESYTIKKLLTFSGKQIDKTSSNSKVLLILEKKIKVKKGFLIFKILDANIKKNKKRIFFKPLKIKYPSINIDIERINDDKQEYFLKIKNQKDILKLPDNFKDYIIMPLIAFENLKEIRFKLNKLQKRVIWELPFFTSENEIANLKKFVQAYIDKGYYKFYIHSKCYLELFQNKKDFFIISSEKFNIANSFSHTLLRENRVKRWVLSVENDNENLKAINNKKNSIIMVYSNMLPLMISRFSNKIKNNSILKDDKDKKFLYKSINNIQYIYSTEPFNITQYLTELKKIGFRKFLFELKELKNNNFYNSLKYGKFKKGSDFNFNHQLV